MSRCWEEGRTVPGYAVDHVVPHRQDPRLMWDTNNLQVLCRSCHNRKAQAGL
jgi:5-methylcytosine-specific restriction protein A